MTWRNKVSTKDRGIALRDRVETRRLRARSKWATIKKEE